MEDVTGMEEAERLLWLHGKYGSLPFFEVLESLERQKDYSKFLSNEVRRLRLVLERIAKYEVEPLISHESIWRTMRGMAREVVFPEKRSADQSGCTGGDDD